MNLSAILLFLCLFIGSFSLQYQDVKKLEKTNDDALHTLREANMVLNSQNIVKARREAMGFLSSGDKQKFLDKAEFDGGTTTIDSQPLIAQPREVPPELEKLTESAYDPPKDTVADLADLRQNLQSLDANTFVKPTPLRDFPRFQEKRYYRPKVPKENGRLVFEVEVPTRGSAEKTTFQVPRSHTSVINDQGKTIPKIRVNPVKDDEPPTLEIPVVAPDANTAISNWYLRGVHTGPQAAPVINSFDVEDCAGCRYVWTQVEREVGATRIQNEVYNSFQHTCQEAELSPIFFPVCQRMREYADNI